MYFFKYVFKRSQFQFLQTKARKVGPGYLSELKSVFCDMGNPIFLTENLKKKKVTRFKISLWLNANTISGLSRQFFVQLKLFVSKYYLTFKIINKLVTMGLAKVSKKRDTKSLAEQTLNRPHVLFCQLMRSNLERKLKK